MVPARVLAARRPDCIFKAIAVSFLCDSYGEIGKGKDVVKVRQTKQFGYSKRDRQHR